MSVNISKNKSIDMISQMIINENISKSTSPIDVYNKWINQTGIKYSFKDASWLLNRIKDSLSIDRQILKESLNVPT